tara:strand:+ start:556 stop:711 length:156 start_codon:yes stop_codon:yes gene_type:complete
MKNNETVKFKIIFVSLTLNRKKHNQAIVVKKNVNVLFKYLKNIIITLSIKK